MTEKKYANIEDGDYKAVIHKAFVKVSAKGNKMASLWFRVAGQKSKAFGTYMLHNPRASEESIRMLRRAGLKAETVTEVEEQLETLVGNDVEIKVYTSRDGFQNAEILPEIELDEEDIPF